MSYRECIYCHANLDPNELCDCSESSKKRAAPELEPPQAADNKIPMLILPMIPQKIKRRAEQ